MSNELEMFDHVFRVPHSRLFDHRPPDHWLVDLWGSTADLFPGGGGREALGVGEADKKQIDWVVDDGVTVHVAGWELECHGTERALRWVCAALNQHAEQSPHDGTPPGEADRLEATLADVHEYTLVIEDQATNDGRIVRPGGTHWGPLPLPVRGRIAPGTELAVLGYIVRVWRDGGHVQCAIRWTDATPPDGWVPCADGVIVDQNFTEPARWITGGLLEIGEYQLRGATMNPPETWAWA